MPRTAKVVKLRNLQPTLPVDILDLRARKELIEKLERHVELKKLEQAGAKANKERKGIENELMELMGNYNKAIGPNNSLMTWKIIEKDGYEVKATSYRQFSIEWSVS